jgi:dihydropteroate synthase
LAANVIGLQKGVSVFRVHDVDQTRKALTIAKKILNSQQYIS